MELGEGDITYPEILWLSCEDAIDRFRLHARSSPNQLIFGGFEDVSLAVEIGTRLNMVALMNVYGILSTLCVLSRYWNNEGLLPDSGLCISLDADVPSEFSMCLFHRSGLEQVAALSDILGLFSLNVPTGIYKSPPHTSHLNSLPFEI